MATDQKAVETVKATFTRWLSDGESWIGVFENQDLGHYDLGRRIAFRYDTKQFDQAILGKATAPDHAQIGLGWRYLLVAKCKTADEAFDAMKMGGDL